MRVRVTISSTALLLLLLGAPGSSWADGATISRIPFDIYVDTCNEFVTGEGSLQIVERGIPDSAGGFHGNLLFKVIGTAVGHTTGTTYHASQIQKENVAYPAGGTVVVSYKNRITLISEGGMENSYFYIQYHATVTPDGTVIVESLKTESECLWSHY